MYLAAGLSIARFLLARLGYEGAPLRSGPILGPLLEANAPLTASVSGQRSDLPLVANRGRFWARPLLLRSHASTIVGPQAARIDQLLVTSLTQFQILTGKALSPMMVGIIQSTICDQHSCRFIDADRSDVAPIIATLWGRPL